MWFLFLFYFWSYFGRRWCFFYDIPIWRFGVPCTVFPSVVMKKEKMSWYIIFILSQKTNISPFQVRCMCMWESTLCIMVFEKVVSYLPGVVKFKVNKKKTSEREREKNTSEQTNCGRWNPIKKSSLDGWVISLHWKRCEIRTNCTTSRMNNFWLYCVNLIYLVIHSKWLWYGFFSNMCTCMHIFHHFHILSFERRRCHWYHLSTFSSL